MDVNTEHPTVVTSYANWISEFVKTYSIDGLRIDAAKHVREDFWPGFCEAAGVFCIGEVFAQDMPYVCLSLLRLTLFDGKDLLLMKFAFWLLGLSSDTGTRWTAS